MGPGRQRRHQPLCDRALRLIGWRRIRALEHHGVTHLIAAVGSDTPVAEGDPVLVILEASDEADVVYLVTLSQVAKVCVPHRHYKKLQASRLALRRAETDEEKTTLKARARSLEAQIQYLRQRNE